MLKNLFKSEPGTAFPDYLLVSKRKVKWARLQVFPSGEVQMVVPKHYQDKDISALFDQKRTWIESKRAKYQQPAHQVLGIEEGQLLLRGQGYDWQPSVEDEVSIDHENRLITAPSSFVQKQVQEDWYRKIAKNYLTEQINQLAADHGYSFNRLFIRAQRTRWGSCSAQGNISLNWRLIKAPKPVSDYVILHELAHTRFLHHGPSFWQEVERVAPDFRAAKDWLKSHGPYL